MYNNMFIDSLCFMVVDKIKKHLLGLTQSPWPSVLISISGFGENRRTLRVLLTLLTPTGVPRII